MGREAEYEEKFQRGRRKFQSDRKGSRVGLLCSQAAHDRNVLSRCAHDETDSGPPAAHLAYEGERNMSKLGENIIGSSEVVMPTSQCLSGLEVWL